MKNVRKTINFLISLVYALKIYEFISVINMYEQKQQKQQQTQFCLEKQLLPVLVIITVVVGFNTGNLNTTPALRYLRGKNQLLISLLLVLRGKLRKVA